MGSNSNEHGQTSRAEAGFIELLAPADKIHEVKMHAS